MASEVIEHHDVAKPQGWHETLFDPRQEALPVDGPVEHEGGTQAVTPQACDERHRLPVSKGHLRDQALPRGGPAPQPRHIRLCPGFVDEDQASGIDLMLMPLPERALAGHIRAILFGGVQAFF